MSVPSGVAGAYAVEVRDHVMIAHSFTGALFGPAQALHGATFVVDVAFYAAELVEEGVVIDIGAATDALKSALDPLRYQNLDTLDAFGGLNTTTEVLARWIFDQMCDRVRDGSVGKGAENVLALRVTLGESHVARAWFEGPVPRDAA